MTQLELIMAQAVQDAIDRAWRDGNRELARRLDDASPNLRRYRAKSPKREAA